MNYLKLEIREYVIGDHDPHLSESYTTIDAIIRPLTVAEADFLEESLKAIPTVQSTFKSDELSLGWEFAITGDTSEAFRSSVINTLFAACQREKEQLPAVVTGHVDPSDRYVIEMVFHDAATQTRTCATTTHEGAAKQYALSQEMDGTCYYAVYDRKISRVIMDTYHAR